MEKFIAQYLMSQQGKDGGSKIDPRLGLTNASGRYPSTPTNTVQAQPLQPLPTPEPREDIDDGTAAIDLPTGEIQPIQAPAPVPIVEKQQSPEMASLIASILKGGLQSGRNFEGSTQGDYEGQKEFYDRLRRR